MYFKHQSELEDIYSQRFGAVEPVFGNFNTNKRLSRFSLGVRLRSTHNG